MTKRQTDQLATGHRPTQELAYKTHSTLIYKTALRYVANPQDAADITNRSFQHAFAHIKRFVWRSDKGFASWLRQIAINEALQFLRKRSVQFVEVSELANLPADEPESLPTLDGKLLHQLICELPAGYRAVFNLHVLDDKSHKEIAQLIGITESASRSQLTRAKQLLRKKLENKV